MEGKIVYYESNEPENTLVIFRLVKERLKTLESKKLYWHLLQVKQQ